MEILERKIREISAEFNLNTWLGVAYRNGEPYEYLVCTNTDSPYTFSELGAAILFLDGLKLRLRGDLDGTAKQ